RAYTRQNYLVQDALTGNGIASLLLGFPASGRVDYSVLPYYQTIYTAPWLQDDIKLTRRLTLNVGLRWDLPLPPTERLSRANADFLADVENPISSRIDQAKFPGYKVKGGIGFAGRNGLSRRPFDTDFNNVQPRIGAAFQLNSKSVVRGGYGLFYVSPISRGYTNGFSIQTPFVSSLDGGRTPSGHVANPFPDGGLPPPGRAA